MTDEDELLIYHIFADDGVESRHLESYGRVVRVGIDARDGPGDEIIKADARALPLEPVADLAVLHPPCSPWVPMRSYHGAAGDETNDDNLIDLAREIGEEYADHYIIENRPESPLEDPVVLSGPMFCLPILKERAFETSFPVEQPPESAEFRPFRARWWDEYTRPRRFWRGVKGTDERGHRKDALVKGGIPRAYIDYLALHWLEHTGLGRPRGDGS